MLPANTEAAQAVKNGRREAASLAELRVDVERVQVTGETVDSSLLLSSLLLDNNVWVTLGRRVYLGGGTTVCALLLSTEVARAPDEDGALIVKDVLTGLCVLSDGAIHNKSSSALIHDFDELGDGDELRFRGNGELADLKELLAVQEHAGVEVGHDVGEVEGSFGVKWWDDTKSGDDLKVVGAFVDEREIGALGTDSEVLVPLLAKL